jgi:hypothetical protein
MAFHQICLNADRQAYRTALDHPALCAGKPCSVHFLVPTRGASLRAFSTCPVDSLNMPPFSSLSQQVSLSVCPLVSKTYAIFAFA